VRGEAGDTVLRPGAAVTDIQALEAGLGTRLPPSYPGPLIRSQTSDHPGLLGGVQLLESDLDLKLVIESRPRAVVSKIVLVQPQPTTWANLWFQHCSKSIDDIALAGLFSPTRTASGEQRPTFVLRFRYPLALSAVINTFVASLN
jgi:hypothetical protein